MKKEEIEKYKRAYLKAKVRAASVAPHFSLPLAQIKVVAIADETRSEPAATDGRVIFLYPRFLSESNETRAFILLHEALHILLLQLDRADELYERKYKDTSRRAYMEIVNLAADAIVNTILSDHGLHVPSWAVTPYILDLSYDDVRQKPLEEIIVKLMENKPDVREVTLDLDGSIGDDEKKGEVISEGSDELYKGKKSDFKKAIKEMLRKAGNSALGNIRELDSLTESQCDWRSFLRHLLRTNIRGRTWVVEHRKYRGIQGRSKKVSEKKANRIFALLDTSGSISQKELTAYVSELRAAKRLTDRLTIVYFDTEVQGVSEIRNERDFQKIKPKGGGGTCISPALKYIFSKSRRNDIAIVLTDGEWFDTSEAEKLINEAPIRGFIFTTYREPDVEKWKVVRVNLEG